MGVTEMRCDGSQVQSAIRVGLVGHRDLTNPSSNDQVRQEARAYLRAWCRQYDQVTVLSELAIGADTLLTQEALALGCRLEAVLPFPHYEQEFSDADRDQYQRLLSEAIQVTVMSAALSRKDALTAAGHWIVDQADILLAVWDGRPAQGRGGTKEIVMYAETQGKPVVTIWAQRSSSLIGS